MKIVELRAENIKRIIAVHVAPEGACVVVGGRNAQGKTSVLDSILYALGGKSAIPTEPLRRGTSKGEIMLDLGDIVIERTFTPVGTALVVRSHEGALFPSPQAMLDKLYGRLSFDPLAFSRMPAKEQAATLRQVIGLDTQTIDAYRAELYAERTSVNRDLKALEGQLSGMPGHPGTPKEEVSIRDLTAQFEAATEKQRNADAAATHWELVTASLNGAARLVESLKEQLAAAETAFNAADVKATEARLAMEDAARAVPDMAPIRALISEAEGVNAKVRANKLRADTAALVELRRKDSTDLSANIATQDEKRATMLREAAFPVPGLGFSEEGEITLNGLPFDQASGAEQLRTSVAIGIAANPLLKVLLVRDGSALDSEGMALIAEMATAADAQVWVERVSEDGAGVQVMIEDGEVVLP